MPTIDSSCDCDGFAGWNGPTTAQIQIQTRIRSSPKEPLRDFDRHFEKIKQNAQP